ncbi:tetratricopeptide repeat protein, partial [Escherichia coli]|uniref:tetratricopeptide repeat protein n=1 Tax=Escherichia coli TaxID=562 RepID=UPI003D361B67
IGPDPRNFNQRVSLGRNDLLIRTFPQGSVGAYVNIGYMYKHGQGVEKDYQAAFEWFTKAAECNDATAWYNLAIMYHYGEGRPVDLRQALDLYRKVQSSGTRDVSQEIRETEDLL